MMLKIINSMKIWSILILCGMGFISAQNSAPLIPTIYAKADSGKIIINWTNEAVNSVDSLTGYRDFEGFRIYKSTDGGETWGGPDDRIYYNGEAKGWNPLAQFDFTVEEDSLFCLKTIDCDIDVMVCSGNMETPCETDTQCVDNGICRTPTRGTRISGIDPLSPWVNLGENTGLEYTYTDNEVYNGKEYTYAIVSYDMGLRTYELSYVTPGDNSGICTASDNSESMLTEEACCTTNSGAWDPELDRCTYSDCTACSWEELFNQVQDWDVTNPAKVELFHTTIDSSSISVYGMICDDFTGLNDADCLDQVAGDFCNDSNNYCVISNYEIVNYDTTIVSGLPSLESSNLVELSEKIIGNEISIDTLSFAVTTIPGFYAENVENISFEGVENADGIILQAEDQTVGNGLKSFMIVNQDDLTESVYRFEIQADYLLDSQGNTVDVFGGYATGDPSLYVYEIKSIVDTSPLNYTGYELIEENFSDIITDLNLEAKLLNLDEDELTECNPSAEIYAAADCILILNDIILDLPGSELTQDGEYRIPVYKFEKFELNYSDDLGYSTNFTHFIDGLKFRFDNSLFALPSDKAVAVNSLKYIYTNDSGERDTVLFENSQYLEFEMKYGNEGSSFYKRPSYSYSIKFSSEPKYEVASTIPSSGCSDNPHKTLLPFQITNLTTGKVVGVYHTDKGTHYKDLELYDNCTESCSSTQWCNNGTCTELLGVKDCYWEPGEKIAFKFDEISTLTEAVSEEYTFDLYGDFAIFTGADYDSSATYSAGAYVKRSGMLWLAMSSISANNEPTLWIDSNEDGVNENPWKPIYGGRNNVLWNDGDELIIEPTSWYADGDAWIADFSQIGEKTAIDEEDLSNISVVPNPYFSHSRFDETASSRLMWFTHLPTYCYISIYTVSGELVTAFEHNDEFSGQESWNLRSGHGDEVAPGLYIYSVESGSYSSAEDKYNFKHIGKFAIVR